MRRRPLALALSTTTLTAVTLMVLAGCSGPAAPQEAPAGAVTSTPSASAEPEVTPTADAVAEDPTCQNIIPRATADDFVSLGWSAQSEPFRIGSIELDEGIQCKWGDQKITTDRVQMFGWARIDDTDAAAAEKELVASGWRREVGDAGTYITEDPSWAISTDGDGYGITYLFGDGWVKLADTRQSLVLVEGPQ